jgi:hypothetical protein
MRPDETLTKSTLKIVVFDVVVVVTSIASRGKPNSLTHKRLFLHDRAHKLTRSLLYHSLRISFLLHLSLLFVSFWSSLSTAYRSILPDSFTLLSPFPRLDPGTFTHSLCPPSPSPPPRLTRRPHSPKPRPGSKRFGAKPTRPSPSSSSVTSSTSLPPLAGRSGSSPKRTPRKKGCCL